MPGTLGLTPQAMSMTPLRGWAFAILAVKLGEKSGLGCYSTSNLEVNMPTIFERIIAGEIPCHKIWEDEDHLAFLDINPRVEGHTLVIPKKPWFEVFAMDEDPYIALWSAAQTVARHLQQRTGCARVVIVVLGYEVEHVHIHLLPTNHLEDFPFPPVDQAALARIEETAELLRT